MPSAKEIVDVVVGKPGATSDINIWRERYKEFSEEQKFQGDKAYVGEAAIDTPQKKRKNKQDLRNWHSDSQPSRALDNK